ncbi:GNAT family N-acetyltransferase [Aureliella helgolandensis]|uniref:Acetyltransferase (GNAT) family protein n=1 Tax=Aureliella helgolandensis TaxID=2527968 RepID=A0A518G8Q5_9BACT|nr:GNAT family N-acetyltransferase [Aureliella helgolandensis]QDV24981.1 Acetyltransferase (GNAT) family protein [Aureliella helgolandensis]
MTEPPYSCRAIIEADWPSILRIQSEVYYDFAPEPESVMRSKALQSPATCFVATGTAAEVIAYCLAHPYPANRTAQLGTADTDPINPTDNLFVHDLAVQKASEGCGVARALFTQLSSAAQADGYRTMTLVAVQGATDFWSKMGFTPSANATIHESYTGNAIFMMKIFATGNRS